MKKYLCCDDGYYSGGCPPDLSAARYLIAAINPYAVLDDTGAEGDPAPVASNGGVIMIFAMRSPAGYPYVRFVLRDRNNVLEELPSDIIDNSATPDIIQVVGPMSIRSILAHGYCIAMMQISANTTDWFDVAGVVYPFFFDEPFEILKLTAPFNRDPNAINPLTLNAGVITSHFISENIHAVQGGYSAPATITKATPSFYIGDFGNASPYQRKQAVVLNNYSAPVGSESFPDVTCTYDSAGFSDGIGLAVAADWIIENPIDSKSLGDLLPNLFGGTRWIPATAIGITP